MDNNELLTRIKEKDKDAFLQFMQSHGEKLIIACFHVWETVIWRIKPSGMR